MKYFKINRYKLIYINYYCNNNTTVNIIRDNISAANTNYKKMKYDKVRLIYIYVHFIYNLLYFFFYFIILTYIY